MALCGEARQYLLPGFRTQSVLTTAGEVAVASLGSQPGIGGVPNPMREATVA